MTTLFRFKSKGKSKVNHSLDDDPFSTRPFPEEGEEENRQRIWALQEATRISREIDQSLLEAKKLLDKKKKATKILLLGQSESGKSSLLKNFQLAFAPNSFQSERAVWKVVIQLNLIRSIKTILEVLQLEWDAIDSTSASTLSPPPLLTDNHRRIRLGLSPLISIETSLYQMLSPSSSDRGLRDVCVRAGSGWKGTLTVSSKERPVARKAQQTKPPSPVKDNDPTYVLAGSRDDIITLWEDPAVKNILKKHNVRLEESPGFFLNDTARITDPKYEPTNSDIIRARVRTMGIEEHRFVLESGRDLGNEVYITDVSGSRGQRSSWVPFFDDVHAILFLAPLSFNQTLEEDPNVNRLEDSLSLWRGICQNKLLARANIILFFNKMDLLAANLDAGMIVKKYVPSYGDLPNDIAHVTKYFHNKFRAYHKKLSPESRPFLCYETSAIDTGATSVLLVGVHEAILRSHLERLKVI